MKRTTILLLALICGIGNANAQQSIVKGAIQGLAQGHSIIVNSIAGGKLVPTDTLSIEKEGKYEATLPVAKPTMYIFTFDIEHSPMVHVMLLPKEKVTLDLNYLAANNYMDVVNVKGSANMATYKRFANTLGNTIQEQQKIDNEYSMASTTDERRRELQERYQRVMAIQSLEIERTLREGKDNLISAFLVTFFEEDAANHIALYGEIRDALIGKYGDNEFVQHIDVIVKKNIGPGMEAPEIAMKNPDGKTLKLSDLRGKVVMIDFWASWCRPCRMENPNVVKLYHKYHEAGFEIYSVSLDKDKASWVKAIQDDGLVWPNHVSDLSGWTSSGGASYGVMSVPTTVLVDKDGKIIAKNLRGPELAKKLQEIFGF